MEPSDGGGGVLSGDLVKSLAGNWLLRLAADLRDFILDFWEAIETI